MTAIRTPLSRLRPRRRVHPGPAGPSHRRPGTSCRIRQALVPQRGAGCRSSTPGHGEGGPRRNPHRARARPEAAGARRPCGSRPASPGNRRSMCGAPIPSSKRAFHQGCLAPRLSWRIVSCSSTRACQPRARTYSSIPSQPIEGVSPPMSRRHADRYALAAPWTLWALTVSGSNGRGRGQHRSADDAGARVTGERLGNPGKVMGRQIEVAVQLDDEVGSARSRSSPRLKARTIGPPRARGRDRPGVDCLDPVVPLGELLRELTRAVGRAVVDDHPAPRWQLLVGERAGQPGQMPCLVAHGSDHRVVHARPTVPARPDVTCVRTKPLPTDDTMATTTELTPPLADHRNGAQHAPAPLAHSRPSWPTHSDAAADPADGGRRDRFRVDARADVDSPRPA